MNKTLVFATSNKDKVREVNEMLSPLGYTVISLKDLGLKCEREESAPDYMGNARIKAEEIAEKCDYPVFSDDSGLSIHGLDGFPGVHSARFMEGQPYHDKCEALLKMLEGKKDRTASYYCAVVYIDKKNGIDKEFLGINDGEISKEIDEHPIGGFGYDPIFYSYDLNKMLSQVTDEVKNTVSHRGRAIKQLGEFLVSQDK